MRTLPALLLLAVSACAPLASDRAARGAPAVSASGIERGVHNATNGARARGRRGALRLDAALSDVARRHSADMVRRGYFSHSASDRSDATVRAARGGQTCRVAVGSRTYVGFSENLAQVWTASGWTETRSAAGTRRTPVWRTPDEIVAETVGGWLESPGHRRALLLDRATREGIGVALDVEGRVFVTQLLC